MPINYQETTEYKQLVAAIADGCLLFVGSGISKAAQGMPVWSQLIKAIAAEFQTKITPEIENHRLEYLEDCGARDQKRLDDVLNRQLRTLRKQPAKIHEYIASIPWAVIVTTNFDTLLEDAFTSIRRPFVVIDSQESIPHTGLNQGTLIVKMHGSLTSAKRVLTASEYERFDLESPIMKSLLVSLFAQYPIVFAGAGLSDPNFGKLYGMVHHGIGAESRPRYYVSGDLPGFVKDYWNRKRFSFITIPHGGIEAFLAQVSKDTREAVESRPMHRGLRTASIFAKTYALEQLASASTPWDDLAYARMQDAYTSYVQMKDYSTFAESWEQTLYEPLRQRTIQLLDECGQGLRMAYVAPGPHAPLFNDSSLNLRVDDNLSEIVLIDISKGIVDTAQWHLGQLWRNASAKVLGCVCDVTGGEGNQWAKLLGTLLADFDTIEAALDTQLKDNDYALKAAIVPNPIESALSDCKVATKFGFIYSEMIASFTGTAPLMAFETLVKRNGNASDERAARIVQKSRRLWQRFNDAVFRHQLHLMAEILDDDGLLVIAFDVEKKYVDPMKDSVYSFSNQDGPVSSIPSSLRLIEQKSVMRASEESIWWVDYPYGAGITINSSGFEDDYFLDHRHRVNLHVYKKSV